MGKFDLRHKETLRLFLKEYFQLFFPDLAKKINFKTVKFLEKELLALFDKKTSDVKKRTDALILLETKINGECEWILIHWEQQGKRKKDFEERMFHYYCGIYFKFRKLVFPIAMFTDGAVWRKPVKKHFEISLLNYPIIKYEYQLIKLKTMDKMEMEQKMKQNPLAAAYLPLTHYKKEERALIMAKAIQGVASLVPDSTKRATLLSLIEMSLELNQEEEIQFNDIINNISDYKEAKMLKSVEEYGREEGREEGREKGKEEGKEEVAVNLLKMGALTVEQIAQATKLTLERINNLTTKESPASA